MERLTVVGLLPSAERFAIGGKPGVDAEIPDQTIHWQARHVAAIHLRGVGERSGEKADGGHRERPDFGTNVVSRERKGSVERRDFRSRFRGATRVRAAAARRRWASRQGR